MENIIKFFIDNGLAFTTSFEHLHASKKGLLLLDYLGIKYDFDSSIRYSQVYRSLPDDLKDLIDLKINKDEIGYEIANFQWIHTIIVPKFYNDKTPIPEKVFKNLNEEFIRHFGGATRFVASGDYISVIGGHQEDKCEVWDGYGTDENYAADKNFIRKLALKVGSKNYCDQEAVTISEKLSNIEIIKTQNIESVENTDNLILELQKNRLFTLRSMVLLSGIAATMASEQNLAHVGSLAITLGL